MTTGQRGILLAMSLVALAGGVLLAADAGCFSRSRLGEDTSHPGKGSSPESGVAGSTGSDVSGGDGVSSSPPAFAKSPRGDAASKLVAILRGPVGEARETWEYFVQLGRENPESADALSNKLRLYARADLIDQYLLALGETGTVRETAMRCLARVGGQRAIEGLVQAYDEEKDHDEREDILRLIGRFGENPLVADRMKAAAEDPEWSSDAAVEAMSQIGDPEAQADYFIKRMLASTSVAKHIWLDGLGRLAARGSSSAEAALVKVIRSTGSTTDRVIAFRVLSRNGKLSSLSPEEISELEANK